MSNAGDESRLLLSPSSSFPQQGQVDWTALSKNTVEFTIDTLSRLSRAGVEALTVVAGTAVSRHARLDSLGEKRLQDALRRAGTFSSKNEALYFGFGIKSLIRILSETQEGLSCVGICSCLTEEFSTETSAKILRELFLLYQPPEELIPSLQQWYLLVQACSGIVTSSDFGNTLFGIARLCLPDDGQRKLCSSSAANCIAKALKGLLDVSSGKTQRIRITGGADCAWLAATAHWLLGLDVTVEDGSGNLVYRPGRTKSSTTKGSQVIICYGGTTVESSVVVQRTYVVPNGRALVTGYVTDIEESLLLTHGRPNWSTCLCDTFGKPMRTLLTTLAAQTGACLGSAARIYEHYKCDAEVTKFFHANASWNIPASTSSFGRGFYACARDTFAELHLSTVLLGFFETMLDRSPNAAFREFADSIGSIRTHCNCNTCRLPDDVGGIEQNSSNVEENKRFCSVALVGVLLELITILSQIKFQKGHSICPTFAGIERFYSNRNVIGISGLDLHRILFPYTRNEVQILDTIRELFTGRGVRSSPDGVKNASALASDGVCVYFGTLCNVSSNPESACSVYVVPGNVEWRKTLYNEVTGPTRSHPSALWDDLDWKMWPYDGKCSITSYDDLIDSSSGDLKADLVIEEIVSSPRSIMAQWQISSSKGRFLIQPKDIASRMAEAYVGGTCQKQGCGSLNGFKTCLVDGEGTRRSFEPEESHAGPFSQDPIIRVLSQDAAVWVALWGENSGSVFLQGRRCIKCAVMTSITRSLGNSTSLFDKKIVEPVCILTAI